MNNQNKPTIPEVVAKFASYFEKEGNSSWGSLHIVLDDGNVQDSHVQFCLNSSLDHNDLEGAELSRILLRMSKTQRLKMYAKVKDFIKNKPA